MTGIFVSHAATDEAETLEVLSRLRDAGWRDVFVDNSPEHGLEAGARWQSTLLDTIGECEAFLCLLSDDWIASKWCWAEYVLARKLGNRCLPLTGRELMIALQWRAAKTDAIARPELDFIDVSERRAVAAANRAQRTRRWITRGAVIASLVLAVVARIASWQATLATRARTVAIDAWAVAEQRTRAARAGELSVHALDVFENETGGIGLAGDARGGIAAHPAYAGCPAVDCRDPGVESAHATRGSVRDAIVASSSQSGCSPVARMVACRQHVPRARQRLCPDARSGIACPAVRSAVRGLGYPGHQPGRSLAGRIRVRPPSRRDRSR